MRSDLHIHPLAEKYYYEIADKHFLNMYAGFSKVVLDEEDKENIRDIVRWSCYVRSLDAIALSDHDMCQSGRYVAEFVR